MNTLSFHYKAGKKAYGGVIINKNERGILFVIHSVAVYDFSNQPMLLMHENRISRCYTCAALAMDPEQCSRPFHFQATSLKREQSTKQQTIMFHVLSKRRCMLTHLWELFGTNCSLNHGLWRWSHFIIIHRWDSNLKCGNPFKGLDPQRAM